MIGSKLIVKCGNCLELQKSHSAIIDHWNGGNCPFYCTICGESFHNRISQLRPHIENEHKIKYKVAKECLAMPTGYEDLKIKKVPKDKKTALYKCPACDRTFKHRQPLSTHFTMIHRRSLPAKTNPGVSIFKQAGSATDTSTNKRLSLPLMAELKSIVVGDGGGKPASKKKQTQFEFKKDLQMALKKVPSNEITITLAKKKPIEQMSKAKISNKPKAKAKAKAKPSNNRRPTNVQPVFQPEATPQPTEIYPAVELKTEIDYGYDNYADYSNQFNGWNVNGFYNTLPQNTLKVKNLTDLQHQPMFAMDGPGYASTSTNEYFFDGVESQPQPTMSMQSELRIENVQSIQPPTHPAMPTQPFADFHDPNFAHPHNPMPSYHRMCPPNVYMHPTQPQPMYMMHPTAQPEYYGS